MNHFFLWFILSLSIAIVSDFALMASCNVVIVSSNVFMRSVSRLCDLNMSPSPRSNHSAETSGNVAKIAEIQLIFRALIPLSILSSEGWFKPHFSAKARVDSPK